VSEGTNIIAQALPTTLVEASHINQMEEDTDAEFAALLASPSSSTKLLVPSHTDDSLDNNNSGMTNIVSKFQSMTKCSDIDITNGVANQFLDMSDNNLDKAVELYAELHQQATTNNEEEEYETESECYDISLSSSPNYDYLGLDYDDISTTTELMNNLTTTKVEEGGLDDKEKSIDTPLPTITTTTSNNKGQIDKKSTEQLDDEEEYYDNDDDVIGEEYILGTMMVRVLQARNVQVNIIYFLFYFVFSFSVGGTMSSLHAYMVFVLIFFLLHTNTHTHNNTIL
jgi:hypothetical protein